MLRYEAINRKNDRGDRYESGRVEWVEGDGLGKSRLEKRMLGKR